MKKSILLGTICMVMLLFACKKETAEPKVDTPIVSGNCNTDSTVVSYCRDISPLFVAQCTFSGCHNSGSGYGDYTSYTGVKEDADNDKLNNRVIVQKNMPIGSGSLTQAQRDLIDTWLKAGAPNN